MSRLKNLKPNEVKVLLEQYIHVALGIRKSGKTTLFRDLIFEKYDGDMSKGLLLAFEKGYQALDGIYAEDSFADWTEFMEVVNELVSERDELPYRFICIDTIDEMVNMAENEAIRVSNMRCEPSKRCKTINEAFSGYGKGKAYAKRLIKDALQLILKSGYGLFLIGHSKDKTIKEKDGTEYNMLSCSLTNDYTDIFLDMADIIVFLTIDKEIKDSYVSGKKVYMNFRNDTIDCGGRFKELPDKIEYSAKNYLTVFENAVKASILEPKKDIEEMTKEQAKQFEEDAKKNIEKMLSLPEAIKDIKSVIKKLLKEKKIDTAGIMNLLSNYSINEPNDIDDISVANDLLKDLNSV